MARAGASAAVSVERFFQFSLLGLVASGYLAVAGSGYLDAPTIALTAAGLVLRALMVAGLFRLEISARAVNWITAAYIVFFALDYFVISRGFLEATVHLVFFLAVVKILTARTNRDYAYIAVIAFLELLAAAILSTNLNFFLFLTLYLAFAMAAFTSSEIRRAVQRPQTVARSGLRWFHPRLAALTLAVTAGILSLTGGLFFMLPRTATAALDRLGARRILLPGFSNSVRLGEIGEVKASSQPIMHVQVSDPAEVANAKWRGMALGEFDGRRWYNQRSAGTVVPIESGRIVLANYAGNSGTHISYAVDLKAVDTDALFFAGIPEVLEVRRPTLVRTRDGSFRLGYVPPRGLRYSVYAFVEDPRRPAPRQEEGTEAPPEIRARYLQLPALDRRIGQLARRVAAGAGTDFAQASAVEAFLRSEYGYTLELPEEEHPDPLAHFLFERRKGHCEYFASAMAVMLRELGIPARLVTGFQSGVWNPYTGMYVIRAADAHTWVEAWLPGRGWTVFEPTPPDPNRAAGGWQMRVALLMDAAEVFWQDWVLGYDQGRQALLANNVHRSGRVLGVHWLDRLRGASLGWKEAAGTAAREYGPLLALLAGCAVAAVWLGPRGLRVLRIRRRVARARQGQASMADATLLYLEMLEALRRRGYQKPPWFTPREFAAALPPELASPVAQFTEAYNALRFGDHAGAAPRLSRWLEQIEGNDA